MKTSWTLLLFVIQSIGFSQGYHSDLFVDSIIKKNNVCRIIEYNANDSVNYFSKYPKGHYSIYDKNGKILFECVDDFRTWCWMYDSLGREIASFQFCDALLGHIPDLHLSSYDSTGKIVTTIRAESNKGLYYSKDQIEKKGIIADTIFVSKYQYRIEYKKDTAYTDFFINSKTGLIDSTVRHNIWIVDKNGEHLIINSISIKRIKYYDSGNLKSEFFLYYTQDKYFPEYAIYYYENGLIEKLINLIDFPNSSKTVETKFKYFKW